MSTKLAEKPKVENLTSGNRVWVKCHGRDFAGVFHELLWSGKLGIIFGPDYCDIYVGPCPSCKRPLAVVAVACPASVVRDRDVWNQVDDLYKDIVLNGNANCIR